MCAMYVHVCVHVCGHTCTQCVYMYVRVCAYMYVHAVHLPVHVCLIVHVIQDVCVREVIESEEQYEVAKWIGKECHVIGEGRSCDWRSTVM